MNYEMCFCVVIVVHICMNTVNSYIKCEWRLYEKSAYNRKCVNAEDISSGYTLGVFQMRKNFATSVDY